MRKSILNDPSPAATFIAYNYTTPTDVALFEREANRILDEYRRKWGWMHETWHPSSQIPGRRRAGTNYTVWSDLYVCADCGSEMSFWDVAVDKSTGYRKKRNDPAECPDCGASAPLGILERAWLREYDPFLNTVVKSPKRVPVVINYTEGGRKHERSPDPGDLSIIEQTKQVEVTEWFPVTRMPEGDESRRNDDIGITHVHHFYTRRNLKAFAVLTDKVKTARSSVRARLQYWLQTVALGQTLLNRYLSASFSQVNRYLKGTLYVAPFISEVSPWYALTGKIDAVRRLDYAAAESTILSSGSATSVIAHDNSVDYIFTDPPFGANINYADLNAIWESWLGVMTNSKPEAIVSNAHRKQLSDYQELMVACFEEYYRVLRPGRWMTVEFHNSKNSVWNAIQEALLRAGFVVADVRTLDKKQMTMQQMTSSGAVKQDLIISAYKPRRSFEDRFLKMSGTNEGVWGFVRQHLEQLPQVVVRDGIIETLRERQDYLLFDRMVAFHIQRGASVPLSATEFYVGLRQQFVERDGMFFLSEQVPEYDRARLKALEVAQLALSVADEKSSIQWLRQELADDLNGRPQTYQELQPQFLRRLHRARHEELPELREMLEQNFLQDNEGRWYAPDPGKASDLEKLRQRALLREFEQYVQGKGRLRQFRTEAVRAGFAHAWGERDYETIVQVAERLPERVLQEDPDLIMYYDNASLRA